MNRCPECKSDRVTVSTEARPYPESGLPNVIVSGIRTIRCEACGEVAEEMPRLSELHRVIAHAVIRKRARLSGVEVRFLRKFIGWSAQDFARRIGADPSTVSNWELDKAPIGSSSERLLRMLVVHEKQVDDYSLDELEHISSEKAPPVAVRVQARGSRWRSEPVETAV